MTFLPYPDFTESASCLDNRRLGKQRVEVFQILKALSDSNYGWQNHPAVKMWRGYKGALVSYGMSICLEWISRGFQDTCAGKIYSFEDKSPIVFPPFIGKNEFHSSHRAALLFKNTVWYSQFGWTEVPKISYIWPESSSCS